MRLPSEVKRVPKYFEEQNVPNASISNAVLRNSHFPYPPKALYGFRKKTVTSYFAILKANLVDITRAIHPNGLRAVRGGRTADLLFVKNTSSAGGGAAANECLAIASVLRTAIG